MTTFVRSAFKGGNAGAMFKREGLSAKVAGILPVIYEINHKANRMDLSLQNDKLKQIKQFEAKRKLL